MVTVIVASHGELADAFLKTSALLFGRQEQVFALGFYPGDNINQFTQQMEQVLVSCNPDGYLILTDILGGSPYNVAAQIALSQPHVEVVAGVNLPLLLEVLQLREMLSLQALTERIINIKADTIVLMSERLGEQQEILEELE